MSDTFFWSIIEQTTRFEADPPRQIQALGTVLEGLSLDDIQRFEVSFGEQLKRSYRWDLWGADYVAHGGASDDAFEYFRRWLISKGQDIFEAVLAEPDRLAELLAPDSEGPLEFEEFAYVARDVWSKKSGGTEMPNTTDLIYSGLEPEGTPFKEDSDWLAQHYPKLWQRFGENPLF